MSDQWGPGNQNSNFSSNPPPPGAPPPPGFYPPAQPPGGYYPPPPQQGTSPWLYVAGGCGCLAIIAIVSVIGCTAWMATKGTKALAGAMEMAKPHAMQMLTSDHTEADRERFSIAYDALIENTRLTSLTEYATSPNQMLWQQLNTAMADQSITLEESANFSAQVESALNLASPAPAGEEAGEEEADGEEEETGEAEEEYESDDD